MPTCYLLLGANFCIYILSSSLYYFGRLFPFKSRSTLAFCPWLVLACNPDRTLGKGGGGESFRG